jgi:beta-glucosidase
MGRHARGGRNWEGFGPDPYLAGIAMNATVSGIQSTGVQACSKHYVGNEQETQRTATIDGNVTTVEAISANIDDRILHELYIWPFASAVHAGTSSIMCAYNRVNGSYSCSNSEILNTILKEELAFPGYVVSDWVATHSTVDSANNGLDMEQPGLRGAPGAPYYFGNKLLEKIQAGSVSLDRLDDMVTRVMTPYFLLDQGERIPPVDPAAGPAFANYQFGRQGPLQLPIVPARDVRADHAKLIRKIGAAGTVLLKNLNGTLPLRNETSIGLFGNDVSYPTVGSVYTGQDLLGYEQGTLFIGGGSGTVRVTNLVTPLEAIQKKAASLGQRVQLLFDNDLIAAGDFKTIYPTPEVCLLFLKAYASEGEDRPSAELSWNATRAVESTAAMCPTIVITHAPGVVDMPWADNPNVTAILAAHYPGEETGNAIVDILWGDAEPSGRLPYTIARTSQTYGPEIVDLGKNISDPKAWQADYTEGQMIDYRRFDKENIDPLYEFGFGLSYTEFEMSGDVTVDVVGGPLSALAEESMGKAPGGLVDLWTTVAVASIEITNTGERPGFAVPQLYVSLPQDSTPEGTPVKVLRGFEKVHLEVGESQKVDFHLLRKDVSYWDVQAKQWVVPSGSIGFAAGFSSRDLKARAEISFLE